MASNASVQLINNKGDVGAALEATFSEEAMKGYMVAGITAGLTAGVIDKAFGADTHPLSGTTQGLDLSSLEGVGQFALHSGARGLTQAAVDAAINGGSFEEKLAGALTGQAIHVVSAVSFNQLGDWAQENGIESGSLEKIAVKALVGGLISQAATGEFAPGALAAGANEALVEQLAQLSQGDPKLLIAASQLLGAVSGAITGGDAQFASDLAGYDTQYNFLMHDEQDAYAEELTGCKGEADCMSDVHARYQPISDTNNAALEAAAATCNSTGQCADYQALVNAGSAVGQGHHAEQELDPETPWLSEANNAASRAHNEQTEQNLLDRPLSQEVVRSDIPAATDPEGYPFNPEASTHYTGAITAQNALTYAEVSLVTGMALLPGPEDVVIGGALATRAGQKIAEAAIENGQKVWRLLDGSVARGGEHAIVDVDTGAVRKAIVDNGQVELAEVGTKGISWNPLTGSGPLGEKIASTFRSSTYTETVTSEATTLYRVYGGSAGEIGGYWTRTPPAGPVQSIIDTALNPAWGNTATSVTRINVPAGTRIFEGVAAPQGGLVGGGNQVFIQNVNPDWIIK
jgi:hypothetical protein